jgi:hypothetical protein
MPKRPGTSADLATMLGLISFADFVTLALAARAADFET